TGRASLTATQACADPGDGLARVDRLNLTPLELLASAVQLGTPRRGEVAGRQRRVVRAHAIERVRHFGAFLWAKLHRLFEHGFDGGGHRVKPTAFHGYTALFAVASQRSNT